MQAVYRDKCIDISTVIQWVWQFKQEKVGEASLCDKARSGMPLTATDESHKNILKQFFETTVKLNRKTMLLNWESLKKEWATLSASLDSKNFVAGGHHEN